MILLSWFMMSRLDNRSLGCRIMREMSMLSVMGTLHLRIFFIPVLMTRLSESGTDVRWGMGAKQAYSLAIPRVLLILIAKVTVDMCYPMAKTKP